MKRILLGVATGAALNLLATLTVGQVRVEMVSCHQVAQARHGIWNIENLDFEPLLSAGVTEFRFVWSPLKMVGATGSPGNPIAIW